MSRPQIAIACYVLLAGLTIASTAQAQTCACPPPSPPPPPPQLAVTADVGYVNTTGNTTVSTLNATDQLTLRTSPDNHVLQTFGLVYATQGNRVQTSIWTASLKDEYTFTPHVGLYALGAFDRNTFAGIEQRFEEGAGVAFLPLANAPNQLELDVGGSYIEQRATTGIEDDHAALRVAGTYKHTFVANTYFQEFAEFLPDLETSRDYRINSQTDLVAPLSKHVAIKLGYGIRYSNLPPAGFKTTDRLLTSDLQLTF